MSAEEHRGAIPGRKIVSDFAPVQPRPSLSQIPKPQPSSAPIVPKPVRSRRVAPKFLRSQSRKKLLFVVAGLAIVVFVIVVLIHPHLTSPQTSTNTPSTTAPTLQKGTPSYTTILPAGKSISSLGGWTRVSPPGKNAVYAYTDTISGVGIDVSEQPLPNNFKADLAITLAQLAQSFNATQKESAGTTSYYIGTSVNGPQSVILTKDNLLILIKSTALISTNSWTAYIYSLQ